MESFKIGVVNASGGDIQWLETSGDPYDNYQMQIDWKPSGNEIFKHVFNREQNTKRVYTDDLNG